MTSLLAYGSMMYMLGLVSCAVLVWVLNRMFDKAIPLGPDDIYRLKREIEESQQKELMRREVRMCLEKYCWS